MQKNAHLIKKVEKGSPADIGGICAGEKLLTINGQTLEDIFDYHYFAENEELTLTLEKPDGSIKTVFLSKDEEEDLGILFENGLMDDYKSCSNKCIFCFIDQMPPGMRETLYFKDDDSRLSFLQGNYVTLTNMKDKDLERIIRYRLAPINISVHTTNPILRCEMLHNRFAGEALGKIKKLYDAGIEMNGQIVLCKGINDGAQLTRTIGDLASYLPYMQSLSVVPVGLSKYRDGLYPLQPFTKEDAKDVLSIIHSWQQRCFEKWGRHFVQASDEWYLLAGEPLPQASRYDGFIQLENGVGMLRLLKDEFEAVLAEETRGKKSRRTEKREEYEEYEEYEGYEEYKEYEELAEIDNRDSMEEGQKRALFHPLTHFLQQFKNKRNAKKPEKITIATGRLAAPFIADLAQEFTKLYPQKQVEVVAIRNDFFGEQITVSGLLTGKDLIAQLKGKDLGERLLLPGNLLRMGEQTLLDDLTVSDLEQALQIPIVIVKSSGQNLLDAMKGVRDE
jgi:putative radical SAM enzyme (TIGR03279 family)